MKLLPNSNNPSSILHQMFACEESASSLAYIHFNPSWRYVFAK
jgi:hypothetical protein